MVGQGGKAGSFRSLWGQPGWDSWVWGFLVGVGFGFLGGWVFGVVLFLGVGVWLVLLVFFCGCFGLLSLVGVFWFFFFFFFFGVFFFFLFFFLDFGVFFLLFFFCVPENGKGGESNKVEQGGKGPPREGDLIKKRVKSISLFREGLARDPDRDDRPPQGGNKKNLKEGVLGGEKGDRRRASGGAHEEATVIEEREPHHPETQVPGHKGEVTAQKFRWGRDPGAPLPGTERKMPSASLEEGEGEIWCSGRPMKRPFRGDNKGEGVGKIIWPIQISSAKKGEPESAEASPAGTFVGGRQLFGLRRAEAERYLKRQVWEGQKVPPGPGGGGGG